MRGLALALAAAAGLALVAACGEAGGKRKHALGPLATQTGLYLRDDADAGTEHWRSPDVKVDAPPFGEAPKTSADFDATPDEALAEGEAHRVYVRVFNEATEPVDSVRVALYAGPAATMLPRLDGHSGWRRVDTTVVDRIDGGETAFASLELPAGAGGHGHQCLVVSVEAPGLPGLPPDVPADRLVTEGGNVTARNMDLAPGTFQRTLVVRNPTLSPARAELEIRATPKIRASLHGLEGSAFELEGGEERDVTLSVSSPADAPVGEVIVLEHLESRDGERLEGGITYLVRQRP